MTTTKIKTIRGPGQRQFLSAASCSPQGGTKFEGEQVMKIRLLSSAVLIAVLANVGSALAEEPSAIGAYKAEVAKVVQSWVDARNGKLRDELKSLGVWYTVKSEKSSAVQKTAGRLDELKTAQQKLVNSKGDLVKSLAEASIAAVRGKVGADADIRKFNDQIKAIDKDIEDNDGKIRAQENFLDAWTRDDNRIGAELEKTRQEIANTS
jgi:predicted  nucleic acid-binding Zn-ribbon protein